MDDGHDHQKAEVEGGVMAGSENPAAEISVDGSCGHADDHAPEEMLGDPAGEEAAQAGQEGGEGRVPAAGGAQGREEHGHLQEERQHKDDDPRDAGRES